MSYPRSSKGKYDCAKVSVFGSKITIELFLVARDKISINGVITVWSLPERVIPIPKVLTVPWSIA